MKHIGVLIGVILTFGLNAFAQELSEEVQSVKEGQGHVTIHQEEGIDFLMRTMVDENARQPGVDGWQIQLYSGSGPKGKQQAQEITTKMLEEFPEVKTITRYSPPAWRVRVGNYRNRHEALPLLKQLKEMFPNCYVVKETVRMEDL